MTMKLKVLPLLAFAALIPSLAAAPFGYVIVNGSGGIGTIDLASNSTTQLSASNDTLLEALGLSAGGSLYATNSSGSLYSVNTTTGAASLIGSTGRGNIEGLDFLGNTLLGISFQSLATIFSINTADATTTDVVTLSTPISGVARGFAVFDANTGYILGGSNGELLYSVNLTTGAPTAIGSITTAPETFGALDFDSQGNLYALSAGGQEYLLNLLTGAGTPVGPDTAFQYVGLAIEDTAVPEPGTIALIALGLSGIAMRRRRA